MTGKLEFFRQAIEQLHDDDIVWEAYEDFLGDDVDVAPPIVTADSHLWFARVEMIHFWMVETHYPDRVMRQLGCYQVVPHFVFFLRSYVRAH